MFAERIAHIDETLHVEGYDRGIDTFYPTKSSTSKKTAQLPLNYSKVPPLTLAKNEEQDWLENTKKLLSKEDLQKTDYVSWAAYRAMQSSLSKHESAVISLLPMFTENVHSLAMIAHSMRVIKAVVQHVTPSQTPIFASKRNSVIGLCLCLAGFTWRWHHSKCLEIG